jgi:hypothetical protein
MFHDPNEVYSVDASHPRVATDTDGFTDNVSIDQFFARPVRIYELEWNNEMGVTPQTDKSSIIRVFDPWVKWQQDARVKQKLSNYSYFRGNLKLRFQINGNRFQYGKMQVTYAPYTINTTAGGVDAGVNKVHRELWKMVEAKGFVESSPIMFQQYQSTYPTTYLTLGKNNSVEMTLPFVWHFNYLAVNGIRGPLVPSGEYPQSPGLIYLTDINPMRMAKHQTDQPTSASITVYAWMEDMVLSTPTELTPASSSYSEIFTKSSGSEYKDGPVSSVASTAQKVAGKLTKVPVIGEFAKATEIGAGAIGDIAKLFGFSAPTREDQPEHVRQATVGRFCQTIGQDSSVKLSMDPKQELSIDPSMIGITSNDEMAFSSIVTREQFIGKTMWLSADDNHGPFGNKLLFASLVGPHQINIQDNAKTVGNRVYKCHTDTPAGQIASMFAYWRGSVTYRVEVVASQFHAGRLKLQFDPTITAAAINSGTLFTEDVNARYTAILDLETCSEIEFTIPYTNLKAFLRDQTDISINSFRPAYTGSLSGGRSDTTNDIATNFNQDCHMGVFTISVVNDLIPPQATNTGQLSWDKSPVDINVYFRMNDDFEVAQPNSNNNAWVSTPLGPFSSESDSVTSKTSEAITEFKLFKPPRSNDLSRLYFGERVTSVRSLVKRFSFWFASDPKDASTSKPIAYWNIPHFPCPTKRAYLQDDVLYTYNTYLSYMAPAFLVHRGGMRNKLHKVYNAATGSTQTISHFTNMYVERSSVYNQSIEFAPDAVAQPSSKNWLEVIPTMLNGGTYADATNNPTLEWECPFYTNSKYALAVDYDTLANTSAYYPLVRNAALNEILYSHVSMVGPNTADCAYAIASAAGDDYFMAFYLAPPPLWTYTVQ